MLRVRAASVSRSTSDLDVYVYAAPEKLSRFFLGFILLDVHVPDGKPLTDMIVPTWGMLSWRDRPGVSVRHRSGKVFNGGLSGGIGPYDHAIELLVGPMRQWSAIMLPGAWARFVAAPAREYANRAFAIMDDPAFAAFHGLRGMLFDGKQDREVELAQIVDHLAPLAEAPGTTLEKRVNKILLALMDASISKSGELADLAGVTTRTLERTCDEAFGLPPKTLIRRQRFLRSLAQHMANRQGAWIDSIDHLYHDQPQFVREFRQFTGMSPSEFARVQRPLVESTMLSGVRYWEEVKRLSQILVD